MALGNQAQEQPSHLTEFANAIGSPKTWDQALRDPIADESEKGDASIQNDAPPVDDVDGMAQTQSDRPLSSARLLIVGAGMTLTSIINGWSVMMTPIMLELLADGLDLKEHDLQWTLNSFLLPLGCFALVAGRASDIAGGKAMYTIGTIWVAVWTMIAGFMRNGIAFFVCRGLAGVGASLTMASNIRIIVENSAPGRTRGILTGVCVAGLPFGNAIGMLVSGPVAEARGWPSAFFILAGVAMLPLLAIFFVKNRRVSQDARRKRIDWLGGFLFTAGSIILFFCLSQALGESRGWSTPFCLVSAAVGWQYHLEYNTDFPPILRMSVITRYRGLLGIMLIVTCIVTAAFEGMVFSAAIYYQQYKGLSPSATSVSALGVSSLLLGA
ncbi:hypothetical protein NliqN6_1518 [Naganishia liquefaciens]|uniref:Major facilitator superfamily (MFS) profile domain-containing protein n=1 Tax=Naganishia liquefaciens TaxID=104408 RepID=A0A8H3TQJ6_9TREE|nr:hypothetical protein NliqN6_1518 [Naganishia liquefaciens]